MFLNSFSERSGIKWRVKDEGFKQLGVSGYSLHSIFEGVDLTLWTFFHCVEEISVSVGVSSEGFVLPHFQCIHILKSFGTMSGREESL